MCSAESLDSVKKQKEFWSWRRSQRAGMVWEYSRNPIFLILGTNWHWDRVLYCFICCTQIMCCHAGIGSPLTRIITSLLMLKNKNIPTPYYFNRKFVVIHNSWTWILIFFICCTRKLTNNKRDPPRARFRPWKDYYPLLLRIVELIALLRFWTRMKQ